MPRAAERKAENEDSLTFFQPVESSSSVAETSESSSSGVLGSLFGRLWRSKPENAPTPEAAANSSSSSSAANSACPVPAVEGSRQSSAGSGVQSGETTPRQNRKFSVFRSDSTVSGGSGALQDYNSSRFRKYWMPDSKGTQCYQCEEKFTTLRRRHHCRLCGQIFCARCCGTHASGALLGYSGDLRLCDHCAKIMVAHFPESSDVGTLREGVPNSTDPLSGRLDPALASSSSSESRSQEPAKAVSPRSRPIAAISSSQVLNGLPPFGATPPQGSLPSITIADKKVLTGQRKTAANPQPAALDVLSLVQEHSRSSRSSAPETESRQGTREHSNSKDLSSLDIDEMELEEASAPAWVRGLRYSTSAAAPTPPGQISGASTALEALEGSGTPTHGDSSNRSRVPSTMSFGALPPSSLTEKEDPDAVQSANPPHLSHEEQPLSAAFEQRARDLLDYVLKCEKLDPEIWRDVIWRVAREVSSSIEVADGFSGKGDRSNNILTYVHIKKLPVLGVTSKNRAEVIWGTACTKAVWHREMAEPLENASVMLIAGTVEYERVQERLGAIEPILQQEEDFLARLVDRILERRPSIVVVEKSVARRAAERLAAAGVRLVSGVKIEIMGRLSRCTGADILASCDAQLRPHDMGYIARFEQRVETLADGSLKPLLLFRDDEDDDEDLEDETEAEFQPESEASKRKTCTVLLRAERLHELRAAKRLLAHMITALYSSSLELAFLDQLGVKLAPGNVTKMALPCEACYCSSSSSSTPPDDEEKTAFEKALSCAVLSASPLLVVEPPFLETKKGERCPLRPFFRQPLHKLLTEEERNSAKEAEEAREQYAFDRRLTNGDEKKDDASADRRLYHDFARNKAGAPSEDTTAAWRALGSIFMRRRANRCPAPIYIGQSQLSSPSLGQLTDEVPDSQRLQQQQQIDGTPSNASATTSLARQRSSPPPPASDVLDAYAHAKIAFLFGTFSSRSPNAPFFCVRPFIVAMHYYAQHDRTLAEFLAQYCFAREPANVCKSTNCETSMLDHSRKIVLRRVCIEITTCATSTTTAADPGAGGEPTTTASGSAGETGRDSIERTASATAMGGGHASLGSLGGSGAGALTGKANDEPAPILMWTMCTICKSTSHVARLSRASQHLSFARFLAYLASAKRCVATSSRILTDSPRKLAEGGGGSGSSSANGCQHCFFHRRTIFFAQGSVTTSLKVTPIRPYQVIFSPLRCAIVPAQLEPAALRDELDRMAKLADDLVVDAHRRLADFRQHAQFVHYSSLHTSLAELADHVTRVVGDRRRALLDELEALPAEGCTVPATASLANRVQDAVVEMRTAAHQLVAGWREHSQRLAAMLRSLRRPGEEVTTATAATAITTEVDGAEKSTTEKSALTATPTIATTAQLQQSESTATLGEEIALGRLDDPFPPTLHLALKRASTRPGTVPVVVRDLVSGKSGRQPDVGSVIAYALTSDAYADARQRLRDQRGDSGTPLNLSAAASHVESPAQHVEVEFADQSTTYYVKAYFADRFELLRRLLFADGEQQFIRSLATSTLWSPQGGKSGASFYKTADGRFVLKTMSKFEIQSFVKFAPNYFEYLKTAVTERKLTTLCKVYGVYRVCVAGGQTPPIKSDFLVMEYLFYRRDVQRVWDLKGSLRNRWASEKRPASELVLLDENLMKDLWNNQLYVQPHAKAALNQAISNDSHFLSSQHVMDYSLLVGVDETTGELLLGIVDYMRTYTLDKKLESWVKIVAIPGAHLPTILSPDQYCTRFSDAIDTYFPAVPDSWTGLGQAMSY